MTHDVLLFVEKSQTSSKEREYIAPKKRIYKDLSKLIQENMGQSYEKTQPIVPNTNFMQPKAMSKSVPVIPPVKINPVRFFFFVGVSLCELCLPVI